MFHAVLVILLTLILEKPECFFNKGLLHMGTIVQVTQIKLREMSCNHCEKSKRM